MEIDSGRLDVAVDEWTGAGYRGCTCEPKHVVITISRAEKRIRSVSIRDSICLFMEIHHPFMSVSFIKELSPLNFLNTQPAMCV